MQRRFGGIAAFVGLVALSGIAALTWDVSPAVGSHLAGAVPQRTSIVVIMTDDHDVGLHRLLIEASQRDPTVMQHFRRVFVHDGIQRVGTEFTRAYSTTPICCPARATFLTGQYPTNHNVTFNDYEHGLARFDDNHTIATWLTPTYYTGFIGKYLTPYGTGLEAGCDPAETPACDPTYVPPGWDDWQGFPETRMYSYWGFQVNDNGTVVDYENDPQFDSKGGNRLYQTDVIAERAVEFLDEWRADHSDEPFFLVISTVAPHVETSANPSQPECDVKTNHFACKPRPAVRHQQYQDDRFVRDSFEGSRPVAYNEADITDKPAYYSDATFRSGGMFPPMTPEDEANLLVQLNARGASLLAVDDLIGEVFDKTREFDPAHKISFVFLSDQGFISQGQHRMNSKVFFYGESILLPMFVRPFLQDPPPKAQVSEPVTMADFAPTFLEAAGASATIPIDGRSIVPLLLPSDPGPTVESWGRTRFLLQSQARRLVDENGAPLDPNWILLRGMRFFEDDRFSRNNSLFVNHRWYSGPVLLGELGEEFYDLATDGPQVSSDVNVLSPAEWQEIHDTIDALWYCSGNDPDDPESCRSLEDQKP